MLLEKHVHEPWVTEIIAAKKHLNYEQLNEIEDDGARAESMDEARRNIMCQAASGPDMLCNSCALAIGNPYLFSHKTMFNIERVGVKFEWTLKSGS